MAKLRYEENFLGNELSYIRSKNKHRYQFQLHSKGLSIVEIFLNDRQQSDSGFLFPILHSIHNTAKKIDARIDSGIKDLNEDLKQIGQMIGVEKASEKALDNKKRKLPQ
ncbi:hypothetical protein [Segetibacter koreensis]|uniref:hypothetical protein n=1 Tax=Segetibacter koreensis TaxID=398037 RepID=UPI00036F13FA|nr:hypothetical protein [Segetibacter koreensis]